MRTNATKETLEKALERINRRHEGNVAFKRFDVRPRTVEFTLTVKSSRGPGARRGHTGRRVCAACWHVHGHLFEEVIAIQPDAVIRSQKRVIRQGDGNWQDWNIGSILHPLYYSDACDCGRGGAK